MIKGHLRNNSVKQFWNWGGDFWGEDFQRFQPVVWIEPFTFKEIKKRPTDKHSCEFWLNLAYWLRGDIVCRKMLTNDVVCKKILTVDRRQTITYPYSSPLSTSCSEKLIKCFFKTENSLSPRITRLSIH